MNSDLDNVEGFELVYSVQLDEQRIFELWVDEISTGDSVWQTSNVCGQVLERSNPYEDQAHCLRDGLNKTME